MDGGSPRSAPGLTLLTVGHGQRTAKDLLGVLAGGEVGMVVDVRRYPGSRRHPQFGREVLAQTLTEAGVTYDWRGEELGGRRRPAQHSRHPAWRNESLRAYADYMDTPAFGQALERLLDDAASVRLSVLCAETLWWRCHRRLIADAAALRGVEVVHLLGARSVQVHPLHPDVRPDAHRRPVYDRNAQLELDRG